MPKDPSSPATKADIQMLMEEMGKLYQANREWKEEILERVDDRIAGAEERTKHHFDVVAENIRHDLLGMHNDRIENHEDRLRRLERHTGVADGVR